MRDIMLFYSGISLFGALLMLGVALRHVKKRPTKRFTEKEKVSFGFGAACCIDAMLLIVITLFQDVIRR